MIVSLSRHCVWLSNANFAMKNEVDLCHFYVPKKWGNLGKLRKTWAKFGKFGELESIWEKKIVELEIKKFYDETKYDKFVCELAFGGGAPTSDRTMEGIPEQCLSQPDAPGRTLSPRPRPAPPWLKGREAETRRLQTSWFWTEGGGVREQFLSTDWLKPFDAARSNLSRNQ